MMHDAWYVCLRMRESVMSNDTGNHNKNVIMNEYHAGTASHFPVIILALNLWLDIREHSPLSES